MALLETEKKNKKQKKPGSSVKWPFGEMQAGTCLLGKCVALWCAVSLGRLSLHFPPLK